MKNIKTWSLNEKIAPVDAWLRVLEVLETIDRKRFLRSSYRVCLCVANLHTLKHWKLWAPPWVKNTFPRIRECKDIRTWSSLNLEWVYRQTQRR